MNIFTAITLRYGPEFEGLTAENVIRLVNSNVLYDAGALYHYRAGSGGRGTILFRSHHESLFEFSSNKFHSSSQEQDVFPRLTYARRSFDARRLCGSCTAELRGAVVAGGHDLELWHTVDHERRALHSIQRRRDLFKARWVEREHSDLQVLQRMTNRRF